MHDNMSLLQRISFVAVVSTFATSTFVNSMPAADDVEQTSTNSDSSSSEWDDFDLFEEFNEAKQDVEDLEDQYKHTTLGTISVLNELRFSGNIKERTSKLRSDFCSVIHILRQSVNDFTDILSGSIFSLEQLKEDFSKKTDQLEKLILCENIPPAFHHLIYDNIDKILQNPVGRVMISRILASIRGKKILFIPIKGFHKQNLSFEEPALMVITGEKYNIITIPVIQKKQCVIPGVNKKDFSPTMILTIPFHSALAHELIHCMHDFEDKALYERRLLKIPSTCRILEAKARLAEMQCDFPTDEELHTVLGVHMELNDYIDTSIMYGKNISSMIDDISLKIDDVSELMYNIFDESITCLRILYYNERMGSDLRDSMKLNVVAEFLLSMFGEDMKSEIKKKLEK